MNICQLDKVKGNQFTITTTTTIIAVNTTTTTTALPSPQQLLVRLSILLL